MKPLGHKAYGSIGHLPNSRLGPRDRCVPEGQARICTTKVRDRHDRIVVQEKLDGSCTAVALIGGEIHALVRAGWPALSSPYAQHHMFDVWVREHEGRFREVLQEGERLVGEWLAQAHGTRYDLAGREPWAVFDLMKGHRRSTFDQLHDRASRHFLMPYTLHNHDSPLSVEEAIDIHRSHSWPCDEVEGVVYRVERKGEVEFLAKWVRGDKVDGKYLPEVSGKEAVWNWKP